LEDGWHGARGKNYFILGSNFSVSRRTLQLAALGFFN
jgi:hypothetical protein